MILVSGTLDLLAQQVALALTLRLAMRGVSAKIGVCATRAERIDGHYTGKIVGAANFAEEKMIAIRRIAQESGFDLARCYATAIRRTIAGCWRSGQACRGESFGGIAAYRDAAALAHFRLVARRCPLKRKRPVNSTQRFFKAFHRRTCNEAALRNRNNEPEVTGKLAERNGDGCNRCCSSAFTFTRGITRHWPRDSQ